MNIRALGFDGAQSGASSWMVGYQYSKFLVAQAMCRVIEYEKCSAHIPELSFRSAHCPHGPAQLTLFCIVIRNLAYFTVGLLGPV